MEVATKASQERGSYRSILKSTSIIGGASLINMLMGVVRIKFVAVLLGPSGVGLLGMFGQITGLIAAVSGMGLGSSGVRQVAESVAKGDDERTGQTVLALRRAIWITGLLGLVLSIVFCVPISRITFGHERYALSIAILGVTVLFGAITTGQSCLLQGARRIVDLAKISIIGSLSGTLISIPCYYVWGEKGIVVSLILCSLAALIISWWFARRLPIVTVNVPWSHSLVEAQRIVMLGVSFMGAGLMTTLSGYFIQMILVRAFTLEGAGLYQAAFALSGILVNFVLSAMGTDYYPRLTTVANDSVRLRQMVNEQTEISLLLALPCLIAMMVFSPLLIQVFYSNKFVAAIPILQWCTLGVFGRVVSWPMGFVMLAMEQGRLFFITETISVVFHVGTLWYLVKIWGLMGAGIAFMMLYIFYLVIMIAVMQKMVGASWNSRSFHLVLLSTVVMVVLQLNCRLNHQMESAWVINLSIFIVTSWLCIQQLTRISGLTWRNMLAKIRGRDG
jgi:enterobacterial common antigen flippase